MNTPDLLLPGLKNKTVVITGAGGAICGAVARALADAGARVAIWDLSAAAATRQADGITGGDATMSNAPRKKPSPRSETLTS